MDADLGVAILLLLTASILSSLFFLCTWHSGSINMGYRWDHTPPPPPPPPTHTHTHIVHVAGFLRVARWYLTRIMASYGVSRLSEHLSCRATSSMRWKGLSSSGPKDTCTDNKVLAKTGRKEPPSSCSLKMWQQQPESVLFTSLCKLSRQWSNQPAPTSALGSHLNRSHLATSVPSWRKPP